MAKVIAIVNQKGGVAKTTTTNALGIGLARKGHKVLLIDLDPQGNLSMSLGVPFPDDERNSIAALMDDSINNHFSDELSEKYIHSNFGVDFIVGNDNLGRLERSLAGYRGSEFALNKILEGIKDKYDYIIIDCMPSVGNLTENAITAADEVIVPSEPQFFSTKGIQSLFYEIGEIRRLSNTKLKIAGILQTKVDLRTNVAKEFVKMLNEIFGGEVNVFNTFIPVSTKLSECSNGKNIYEYDKNGKGVQAYESFVEEYLNLEV
jgi:chromosome partitioning protein